MSYTKKNLKPKGTKKKQFLQDFEFLADIVGKCILCKDSAHDSISELQLKIMSAITMEKKINFGAVLMDWISKWFEDAEQRKAARKPLHKMFYGRFISILLKKKMKKHIGEKEGDNLNVNWKITMKLFENWKRNPVEILRSKQSE